SARMRAPRTGVMPNEGRSMGLAPATLRNTHTPTAPAPSSPSDAIPVVLDPSRRPAAPPSRIASIARHDRRAHADVTSATTATNAAANQRSAAPALALRNSGVENSASESHVLHRSPDSPVIARNWRLMAATISPNGRSIARSTRSVLPNGMMNHAATRLPAIG